jgi:hypothetical protein
LKASSPIIIIIIIIIIHHIGPTLRYIFLSIYDMKAKLRLEGSAVSFDSLVWKLSAQLQ